jgi:hypothetical protein
MRCRVMLTKPGFHVPVGSLISKDVYVDTRVLTARDGSAIGSFHIFAAPVDLNLRPMGGRTLLTAHEAARKLREIRYWLGHKGCAFEFSDYEQQLFEGLRCGSAVGKWFIPTLEILCGRSADGTKICSQNIYDLRSTGRFKGSFVTSGSGRAPWYLSCTVSGDGSKRAVWGVPFTGQTDGIGAARVGRFSCRPVRVELAD